MVFKAALTFKSLIDKKMWNGISVKALKRKYQKGVAMSQVVEDAKEEKPQNKSEDKTAKKFKATIYLTEEAEQAFAELYANRYMKDRKTDKSKIACEAILDLYKKDNSGIAASD